METEIAKQIDYLGRQHFIQFKNTSDFPDLSQELRSFLKNHGIPCNKGFFPALTSGGILRRHKAYPHLIVIGEGTMGRPFCIDNQNNGRVVGFDRDNAIVATNSSIQKLIGCMYVLIYYYQEIELKRKYGVYIENYKEYAALLRKMLNDIEPGIENYQIWEEEIFQKELGVL